MNKTLLLAAAFAACGAAASAQTINILPNTDTDEEGLYVNGGWMPLAISTSGQYVCGSTGYGAGFVWDIANDKRADVMPLDDMGCEYRHVSDDGLAVGFNGPATMLNCATSEETIVWGNTDAYQTLAEDISADGTTIIGEIANYDMTAEDSWQTKGVVWKDGEMTILPCPTEEQMGFEVSGTKARFISADGTVILGSVIDNFSTYPVIAWRLQDDGTWQLDPICAGKYCCEWTVPEGMYAQMTPGGLSADGKWASLSIIKSTGTHEEDWGDGEPHVVSDLTHVCIALYNMETGEMKEYRAYGLATNMDTGEDEISEVDATATGVANDGTILGYAGGMMSRSGVIVRDGVLRTLTEAFPDIEELKNYEAMGMSVPVSISADGSTFTGWGYGDFGFEGYTINIPEDYDAIRTTKAQANVATQYYTLDGRRVAQPTKGIYIARTADGKARKVAK